VEIDPASAIKIDVSGRPDARDPRCRYL